MPDDMRLAIFRGKWHVYIGAGKARKRISLRTPDRGLADRRLGEYLKQKAEIKGGTNADIFAAYIADRVQTGKPTATAKFSWKALKARFGELTPALVTRDLCRKYTADRRQQGRSDGTIIRDLGVLRSALRWHSPVTPAVFEMPPAPPPRETHLTKAEFLKLREAAARTPHLAAFVELAKATGARAGAILQLTWTRIDFERGIVRLGPDVGAKKRATVPMVDSLRSVLETARKAALTPYVIEFAGQPIACIKTAFRRARLESGRADIGPNTIRHSVAVWMAEEGVPMSEISQYLGHTDTKTTEKHYARYSPTFLRRAGAVLDF